MNTRESANSSPEATTDVDALASKTAETVWTAWPAAERPARTFVLLLFIAALAVLTGMIGGDVLWSITAVVLLLTTLNRWFFPTGYRVDGERLEAAYPLRRRSIRWADARRLVIDPAGGWLSTRRGGSRFDARSGLDLYWGRRPENAMDAVAAAARMTIEQGTPLEIADRRRVGKKGRRHA
ncbi:MAG: hypothetical protein O3A19_05535 [Planctomycetota bacterium]|nr:hypothetical protein [Planctomycetota bacterium]MDA1025872.1 hypothetical protein [Planctomycetota bacterium]